MDFTVEPVDPTLAIEVDPQLLLELPQASGEAPMPTHPPRAGIGCLPARPRLGIAIAERTWTFANGRGSARA